MASTVTLSTLISRVRELTDTVNAPTPTDATIERMVNASLRDLYAKLCTGGGDFLSTSVELITTSGVSTYTLPSDFWQLRGVTWERGDRESWVLYRFETRDRAKHSGRRMWGPGARYRLGDVALGGAPSIEFLPAPDGTYTVRVDYIPDPPTLSAVSPMTGSPGMDDYIVFDVTARVLASEETDPSMWESRRAEALHTCMLSVSLRDENRSLSISDGDADEAGGWWL